MSAPASSEILIPFIGSFSSGKSSLINALLGEELLQADITPEAALPIELRAGEDKSFTIKRPEGADSPLSEAEFREGEFSHLAQESAWLDVRLPLLHAWPNIALVDLPGWSSVRTMHEAQNQAYFQRLSKNYLATQILYLVIISVDEGTLREDVRQKLQELAIGQSPYLLVFSKVDKASPEDLHDIGEHLLTLVTQTVGKAPERILHTSVRKGQIEQLRLSLDDIQQAQEKTRRLRQADALAEEIKPQIEQLRLAREQAPKIATQVADKIWEALQDELIDDYFQGVPYANAKVRSGGLGNDLEELFQQTLRNLNQQHTPPSSERLHSLLLSLGLSAPNSKALSSSKAAYGESANDWVNHALEAAKPGLLSSKKDNCAANRIRDKMASAKEHLQQASQGYAQAALEAYYDDLLNAWGRIQKLITA